MRLQLARIKQRFFPEEWRSRCLEMLDHCDSLFGDELCWSSVKEQVRGALLLMKGEKAGQVITDDLKAANLVLEVIAKHAEREIIYGHRHIYRGTLGFDGKSYRSIAEIALHELHENERFDHEELQDRLERIDAAVASAG